MAGADAAMLAWVDRHAGASLGADARVSVLPLACDGPLALLAYDTPDDAAAPPIALEALCATWGGALADTARHEGARRLGERLADANRRLSELQAALVESESLARLGRVTAGAAHEMNNPLTVISGNAQRLVADAPNDRTRRVAQTIVTASENLGSLIEDLHLFADPPEPRTGPTDVLDLLETAVSRATARAAEGRDAQDPPTEARVLYDAPLPPWRLDAVQIGLAVTEVIANALQAGSDEIVEVRPHIRATDDRLIITVRDTGEGMPRETLERAFEPFFSSLKAGRRRGLGLARARRLVELHGGEIRLQSTPGAGTLATIELPRTPNEAEASQAA
jgi:signal transduction histidine kinase